MDGCYKVVNECLRLLEEIPIPPRQKLHVETQLLRVKMVLLNPHSPASFDNFKALCKEILNRVKMLSEINGDEEYEMVDELRMFIEEVILTIREGH